MAIKTKKIFCCLISILLLFSNYSYARSFKSIDSPSDIAGSHMTGNLYNDENLAELAQVLPSLYTLALVTYKEDSEGFIQFSETAISSLVVSNVSNQAKMRSRPDKSDNQSFPSTNATWSFLPVGFLYYRYGIEYDILPIIIAGFNSYNRVATRKNYITDVVAGAAIPIIFGKLFTSRFKSKSKFSIVPSVAPDGKSFRFDFSVKF